MSLLQFLSGLSLILFGRKLFWLFVGAIGFFSTYGLAARLLQNRPDWVILLIAAAVGLAGAVLAVFVQSLALGLAAFLAGGYFLSDLLQGAGVTLGRFDWFVFAAGGLGAAFLTLFIFEWAVILLSSFAGAALVVQAAGLVWEISALVFFTLFLLGLSIQVGILHWEDQREAET